MFDGSGQPDGERMVDRSGQPDVTRNVIEAHSIFSEDTRIEHTHDRSGQPDERNSSNAQIRTLLEEQRQMIVAEYLKKVGHHELQAAHAEEERRLLREELWRQKLEFRETHQQKSYRDGGITEIPEFYLRYDRETKNSSRIQNTILKIIRQSTGTAKRIKLYERF